MPRLQSHRPPPVAAARSTDGIASAAVSSTIDQAVAVNCSHERRLTQEDEIDRTGRARERLHELAESRELAESLIFGGSNRLEVF